MRGIFLAGMVLVFPVAVLGGVCAPEWASGVSVVAGYGAVTGTSLQVGYRPPKCGFYEKFGWRVDWNQMNDYPMPFVFWDGHFVVDIQNVPVHFDLTRDHVRLYHQSVGLLLDYYPDGAGFRVTSGLYVQKSKVDGKKSVFHGQIDADAAMEWHTRPAPYLGIGYDWRPWRGMVFNADLGGMWVGRPKTILNGNVPGVSEADWEIARKGFHDVVWFVQVYPMIRLGFGWEF